jgi:hypothetical protein
MSHATQCSVVSRPTAEDEHSLMFLLRLGARRQVTLVLRHNGPSSAKFQAVFDVETCPHGDTIHRTDVNHLNRRFIYAGMCKVAEQFSISLAWTVPGAILVVSLALYLRADAGRKRERYVQSPNVQRGRALNYLHHISIESTYFLHKVPVN